MSSPGKTSTYYSGTNQEVITESEIETLCDKALDKVFNNINFVLSVIGDDVKEYVRDYYGVETRRKNNNNDDDDQTHAEETSSGDASQSEPTPPESSDSTSDQGLAPDRHFQQPVSQGFASDEKPHINRGIIRRRVLRRLNGGARRRRPCFPTGAGASTRHRLQRMVVDRLLEREIRKVLADGHSFSGGGSVASSYANLLGDLGQKAVRQGLGSSEGEYSEIKKALLSSRSSSAGKGGDGARSVNANRSDYQGQGAVPLNLCTSEGREKNCVQIKTEERSSCRVQNTFIMPVSPEGGSESNRTGGADAKRSDCMFQQIPKPLITPEKSTTTTGITNWLLPQDSKSDDDSPDEDRKNVIVERLSYPF